MQILPSTIIFAWVSNLVLGDGVFGDISSDATIGDMEARTR